MGTERHETKDLPKVPVPMLLLIHWVTWTKHCLSLDLPCQEKGLNWRISNIFSSFLTLIITKQESGCYRGIQGLSTSCPWTSVVQIPLFSPAPQCASTILSLLLGSSVSCPHTAIPLPRLYTVQNAQFFLCVLKRTTPASPLDLYCWPPVESPVHFQPQTDCCSLLCFLSLHVFSSQYLSHSYKFV